MFLYGSLAEGRPPLRFTEPRSDGNPTDLVVVTIPVGETVTTADLTGSRPARPTVHSPAAAAHHTGGPTC
jgi:hypothetical protein